MVPISSHSSRVVIAPHLQVELLRVPSLIKVLPSPINRLTKGDIAKVDESHPRPFGVLPIVKLRWVGKNVISTMDLFAFWGRR